VLARTGWPQYGQKRAPAGSSVWQLEQCWINASPQFKQKRAAGGLSVWQR
jgi:hypothetical protein